MDLPLVSVICLCYNHERFVFESLRSVLAQTYAAVELIVVDDCSTDGSVAEIERALEGRAVPFIQNLQNRGNCRAFNVGLQQARGKYVIDLAADDVLLPDRIAQQVAAFESLPPDYAVVFSDALLIDEAGKPLGTYYRRRPNGQLAQTVPTGDVYLPLLRRNFICTPTMMMRKAVLDEIGGYDEGLSYEDFDFWIRTGKRYRYHYLDAVTTWRRKVAGSHTQQFYRLKNNPHLHSTWLVCQKAAAQNETLAEREALAVCLRYHLRLGLFTLNFAQALAFYQLLTDTRQARLPDRVWAQLARWRVPLWWAYRVYGQIK